MTLQMCQHSVGYDESGREGSSYVADPREVDRGLRSSDGRARARSISSPGRAGVVKPARPGVEEVVVGEPPGVPPPAPSAARQRRARRRAGAADPDR